LMGWMWGRDILKVPVAEPRPGRPAHFVKREMGLLRDCLELHRYAHKH